MSDLLGMAAGVHRAVELSARAREDLVRTVGLLEGAVSALHAMLAGTTQPDAQQAAVALANLPQELDTLCAILHQAEELMQAYLHHLGVGRSPSPAVPRPLERPSTAPSPVAIGTWGGKTAAEHVRDAGTSIGRKPQGRKKFPVREVRTVEELEELFNALSKGARKLDKPKYDGTFVQCHDGTIIGYRIKARSSENPIIDIKSPDREQLKIHINTQGWDS